jgi:hypothetical protein
MSVSLRSSSSSFSSSWREGEDLWFLSRANLHLKAAVAVGHSQTQK